MNTVLESQDVVVLRIVRAVCLTVALIAGSIVTCNIVHPIKADSVECTELCGSQGVKRFYKSNPYACECGSQEQGTQARP